MNKSLLELRNYLEYLKLSGINDLIIKEKEREEHLPDLQDLAQRYRNCTSCKLASGRIKMVYGEGNPHSKLILIGEGPGADENLTGKPFVGRAGQLLTKMLQAISINRKDVYITNVVKCRPPNNRNPQPDEINACLPYLDEQLEIIQPKLLLLLGKVAAESLLREKKSLGKYRESIHFYRDIKTYVTYHPSALLRNPGWKKYAWIDLQKLRGDYKSL